ncbi:hypothetical protein D9M68_970430 [compost metagenome]
MIGEVNHDSQDISDCDWIAVRGEVVDVGLQVLGPVGIGHAIANCTAARCIGAITDDVGIAGVVLVDHPTPDI